VKPPSSLLRLELTVAGTRSTQTTSAGTSLPGPSHPTSKTCSSFFSFSLPFAANNHDAAPTYSLQTPQVVGQQCVIPHVPVVPSLPTFFQHELRLISVRVSRQPRILYRRDTTTRWRRRDDQGGRDSHGLGAGEHALSHHIATATRRRLEPRDAPHLHSRTAIDAGAHNKVCSNMLHVTSGAYAD
jgi:hypothetical protein